MLPNVYQSHGVVGYWVLGGLVLQLFLESISKGVSTFISINRRVFHGDWSASVFTPFWGIPMRYNEHMAVGVFLHKLPIAMLLSFFLLQSQRPKIQVAILFLIFGMSTPVGTYLSCSYSIFSDAYIELSALVSVNVLHVNHHTIWKCRWHRFNTTKTIS